jgi:hypothetical protein
MDNQVDNLVAMTCVTKVLQVVEFSILHYVCTNFNYTRYLAFQ